MVSYIYLEPVLRLKLIKDYLGKSEDGRDGGPVSQILAYFLDMTVRPTLYRDLPEMHRLQVFQDPVTVRGGILSRRENRDHVLRYFLEDVRVLKEFELKYQDISAWNSVFYIKKLIEQRTEGEISIMKGGHIDDKINFFKQYFLSSQEKGIFKNVHLKGLDTKIQAFNFKIVHNLLPLAGITGDYNSACTYCRKKNKINNWESREHLFIGCAVSSTVWGRINMKLHRLGMGGVELDRKTIIYKLGLDEQLSVLVSEVCWALWRNRNNNVRVIGNNLGGALVVREMYAKRIKKIMQVDRVVLTPVKYRNRWGFMERIIADISES